MTSQLASLMWAASRSAVHTASVSMPLDAFRELVANVAHGRRRHYWHVFSRDRETREWLATFTGHPNAPVAQLAKRLLDAQRN